MASRLVVGEEKTADVCKGLIKQMISFDCSLVQASGRIYEIDVEDADLAVLEGLIVDWAG